MSEHSPGSCIFCRVVSGDVPSRLAYSGELAIGFHDLRPVAPMHVLVVPRRHVTDAAAIGPEDGPLLAEMFAAARQVAAEQGYAQRGYRLVLNVGPGSGSEVPHLHLHVIGGRPLSWPPG